LGWVHESFNNGESFAVGTFFLLSDERAR